MKKLLLAVLCVAFVAVVATGCCKKDAWKCPFGKKQETPAAVVK